MSFHFETTIERVVSATAVYTDVEDVVRCIQQAVDIAAGQRGFVGDDLK